MPYASEAQRRFFHTATARKKGITPAMVHEFDRATAGLDLPERAKAAAQIAGAPMPPRPPALSRVPGGTAPPRSVPLTDITAPGVASRAAAQGAGDAANATNRAFVGNAGLTNPVVGGNA